jgi:hypothetical protein
MPEWIPWALASWTTNKRGSSNNFFTAFLRLVVSNRTIKPLAIVRLAGKKALQPGRVHDRDFAELFAFNSYILRKRKWPNVRWWRTLGHEPVNARLKVDGKKSFFVRRDPFDQSALVIED